jgi:hypothetical protein
MLAIIFALGSMFCAAINDLIFKLYAQRRVSVGAYVVVVGIVLLL